MIVGNGGIRASKQMVPEIDCVRRGFVKKKRGNEGEVGVWGWADLVPLSREGRGIFLGWECLGRGGI